jgi:hypothetical protein
MDAIPDLREVFSLGDNVLVAGRQSAIEIGDSGIETLSDSDLRRLAAAW